MVRVIAFPSASRTAVLAVVAVAAAAAILPPKAQAAMEVSQLAAGGAHTCALFTDGRIKCWGANSWGQLGNGQLDDEVSPQTVSGITSATQIAAGAAHACALLADGSVECWGFGEYGQIGNGLFDVRNTAPQRVANIDNAIEVTAGGDLTCALLADHTIKCWGDNFAGQLGDRSTNISATPQSVVGISDATHVASDGGHTCALLASRKVKCWGSGGMGQLGNGSSSDSLAPVTVSGISNAIQLAAGGSVTCAVLTDGTIKCWGYGSYGEIGNWQTNYANSTPRTVTGIYNAVQVAAGGGHVCAVLAWGNVSCWGKGAAGQLGDGELVETNAAPQGVSGMYSATQVVAGDNHTCALLVDASVECWGDNYTGALGNGADTIHIPYSYLSTPQPVVGLMTITAPPVLTTYPKDFTNSASAGIAFTGPDGAAFMCAVDSLPPVPCTSPVTYTGLAEGQHTFQVTANVDGTDGPSDPATVSWTVDLKSPISPRLVDVPPIPMSDTEASITLTGEVGASFACQLDTGPWTACTSPATLSDLSDGVHTLSVKQIDAAGNSSRAAMATLVVRTSRPRAPVLRGSPSRLTNAATAIFSFAKPVNVAAVTCTLDSTTDTSCTSPVRFAGLAEGPHTFAVTYADAAGRTSVSRVSWTVDLTPPSLMRSAAIGKTKTRRQTTYRLTVGPDPSGIAKVEYSTAAAAPSMTARNVASQTVGYSAPVVFRTGATIRWLRLRDGAGNWSRWVAG